MTNPPQNMEKEIEAKLFSVFPYEHLCCNGDYCKADCDDETRKKILSLMSEVYSLGEKAMLERVKDMLKDTEGRIKAISGKTDFVRGALATIEEVSQALSTPTTSQKVENVIQEWDKRADDILNS